MVFPSMWVKGNKKLKEMKKTKNGQKNRTKETGKDAENERN
jgi:hypothetical protein